MKFTPKTTLITVLLIVTSIAFCNAQEEEPKRTIPTWEVNYNLVTFYEFFPRHRIGIEHNRGELNLGLQLGFGAHVINPWSLQNSTWQSQYQFWEVRPEIKWIKSKSRDIAAYLSLELFYMEARDQVKDFTFWRDSYSYRYVESADYIRRKGGVNLKMGFKFYLNRSLVIDIYGGIGGAMTVSDYYNVVSPNRGSYFDQFQYDSIGIVNYLMRDGERAALSLPLGFKFGYCF